MSQSPAAHALRMQTATHLSHAAQITCLSMAGIGVIISLLGLVV
jgi:hypothetical protein